VYEKLTTDGDLSRSTAVHDNVAEGDAERAVCGRDSASGAGYEGVARRIGEGEIVGLGREDRLK
jgi:hypothetical protein